jgi:hypothetical protein
MVRFKNGISAVIVVDKEVVHGPGCRSERLSSGVAATSLPALETLVAGDWKRLLPVTQARGCEDNESTCDETDECFIE